LLLALLSGPLAAQTTPAHRYWEAAPDSLRRVLDTQRADTARLRTLLHLLDVGEGRSLADYEERLEELVQLTRRLRRPEARAYRLSYAGYKTSKLARARSPPGHSTACGRPWRRLTAWGAPSRACC
jgi:hypothetical protein